ncbi:MAG: MFS transporter, partial [Syntrophomonadaceae bacterium]|nr:MFS transporter [Syntrophomonadaceae bacterium]
ALINFSATFSIIYLLSLYLQVIRGFSAQEAGFILLIQPVLMAIISPYAGRLSDRFEPRIVASLGMALTATGLAVLVTIDNNTNIWLIAGVLLLQGLGFALFASPNMNAVMSSVDRKYYGVASSTTGTMRLVGQALSMAIVSFIFAANLGDAKITSAIAPELLTSSKLAFSIFTALCFAGVFASLSRGKVHAQDAPPSESQ